MKRSDLNHLRRLVAWVRCEIGQDPAEMQKTMIDVADKLGHPEVSDEGKARLVEGYRRAAAVPQYVRDAIKALDRYARPPGQDGGQEKRRADGETRADAGSDGGHCLAGAPVLLERLQAPGRVSKGGAQRPTSDVEKINMADSHAPMCNDDGGCAAPFCPCSNETVALPETLDDSLITEIAFEERMENARADIPDRVFSFARAIERAVAQAQPKLRNCEISQTKRSSTQEVIQRAVNAIQRPEGLTDTRWEYVKAGIRLLVAEVNRSGASTKPGVQP